MGVRSSGRGRCGCGSSRAVLGFFAPVAIAVFGFGTTLLACGHPPQPKKLQMEPIGTLKNVPTTPLEDTADGGVTTPNSGTPSPQASACSALDFENLAETFGACEVPMPRASEVVALKDKLDVKLTPSTPTATPGGRLEIQIAIRNKTNEPVPLYFSGDPTPRFDVETVDSKGRRADLPAGKWPGYPKGYKAETHEAKVNRITLDKNGTAKIKVAWDAVKTKWAPDRAKGWEGRGYPRVPSGPLASGKYSVRVFLPLLGDIGEPPVLLIQVGPS
jgi:hypothetical protein